MSKNIQSYCNFPDGILVSLKFPKQCELEASWKALKRRSVSPKSPYRSKTETRELGERSKENINFLPDEG